MPLVLIKLMRLRLRILVAISIATYKCDWHARVKTEPNPLLELAEQLDQPHPDMTAELPSCAGAGRMGQGALRGLWPSCHCHPGRCAP